MEFKFKQSFQSPIVLGRSVAGQTVGHSCHCDMLVSLQVADAPMIEIGWP